MMPQPSALHEISWPFDDFLEGSHMFIELSDILFFCSTDVLSTNSSTTLETPTDSSVSLECDFLCCSKVALIENLIPHRSHVYVPVTSAN